MNDLTVNNSNNEKQAILARLILNKGDKNLLSAARSFKELTKIFVFNADEESVQEYYKKVMKKYRNLNTRRSYLLNLKRIFSMCVNREIISYNPVTRLEDDGIIRIPSSERTAKPLLVNKSKINAVLRSDKVSDREKAVIMFLANTGCRSSELLELKKTDFEEVGKNYIVKMYMPKVFRNRVFSIKSEFYNYLNASINNGFLKDEVLESDSFLCNKFGEQMSRNGLEKMVTKIWHKVFPNEKVAAHQFRHFFITYKIVVEKLSLEKVRDMVGHVDIATTARYVHDLPTSKDFSIFTTTQHSKVVNDIVKSWITYMDTPDPIGQARGRSVTRKVKTDDELAREFTLSEDYEEKIEIPADEDLAKLFATD